MRMIKGLLALALWLGAAVPASAQVAECNQFTVMSTTAPAVTLRINGIAGKRIGLCGFYLQGTGTSPAIRIAGGTNATTCAATGAGTSLTPVLSLVPAGTIVSYSHAGRVVETIGPNLALCTDLTGTGSFVGTIYWVQY